MLKSNRQLSWGMKDHGRRDLRKGKRNDSPVNLKKLAVGSVWFFKELNAISNLTNLKRGNILEEITKY